MTKTEFERISAVRGVTQIGFLVNDIFCTMDHWCEEHGVGPWKLYRHTRDRLQNVVCQEGICEEDFAFYTARAMLGDLQLEVMQPISGIPFYSGWLAEKGPVLHHFKETVPDEVFADVLDYYGSQGMGILFGGEFFGSKFYFIDSVPELGVLIEIGNGKSPQGAPVEWMSFYPSASENSSLIQTG